ncbi:MAG: hypothetical protein MHMPM18_001700 [Marteilia pararefringens]
MTDEKRESKVALILTGCGHESGSEIHEASSLMIEAYNCGKIIDFFVPNIGTESGELLKQESRLISRKDCHFLETLDVAHYDALLLPGGLGAWRKILDYATVFQQFSRIVGEFVDGRKPIVAVCIAPYVLAKCLEKIEAKRGESGKKFLLTVGEDLKYLEGIKGIQAVAKKVDQFCVDEENKLFSCGAFMHGEADMLQICQTIRQLTREALKDC